MKENKIGVEGAGLISEALKCNTALTELNLCSDGIHWMDNILRIWGNDNLNDLNS